MDGSRDILSFRTDRTHPIRPAPIPELALRTPRVRLPHQLHMPRQNLALLGLCLAFALSLAGIIVASPDEAPEQPAPAGDGDAEPIDPDSPAALLAPTLADVDALSIDGTLYSLGKSRDCKGIVIVLMSTECPIVRRYIPELNRLDDGKPDGIEFYGLISDPTVTRGDCREFRDEYGATIPILFDTDASLADWLKPRTTPEAFLFDAAGELRYRGRIDDLYAEVGRPRQEPTQRDLLDAMTAIAEDRDVHVKLTETVGCIFEAWTHMDREAAGTLEDGDTTTEPADVTYTRDIAPLIIANCVDCHREGQVGPFTLTSYQDVAKRAKQILFTIDEGFMPPWNAEPNPDHPFVDERRLTPEQIATFKAWMDADVPEGDAADLPEAPDYSSGWQLGEPDLILEMDQAFDVSADGSDVYQCFVLPTGLDDDAIVIGYEFQAGAPAVVHHSLLFVDTDGKGRARDERSEEYGYRSFGGVGFTPYSGMGGWAPGAQPFLLPDGMGRPLPGKSDIIMQIHYHTNGKAEKDKSRVGIYLAKNDANHLVSDFWMGTSRIDIPAGEARYKREVEQDVPLDVLVLGIVPHMHLLGREMTVWAELPDGEEIMLIDVQDWDFRWQDQYRYEEPVELPAGTKLYLTAYYDNSANNPYNPNDPPKRVRHGEETTDEMCLCFFFLTTKDPALSDLLFQGRRGGR